MRGTVEASFLGRGFPNPPQDARMDRQDQAAEQLFGEALELERDQREAFLDRVCAGKPALRRKVQDLLDENDQLSGFLSEPAFARVQAVGMASQTVVLAPGKRLLD